MTLRSRQLGAILQSTSESAVAFKIIKDQTACFGLELQWK
jgi:hypothetical protein